MKKKKSGNPNLKIIDSIYREKIKTECAHRSYNFEVDCANLIGGLILCPKCGMELIIVEKKAKTEIYTGPDGSL